MDGEGGATVDVFVAVRVVVVVGAFEMVEMVFDVMLRHWHAEVKRLAGALYCGRQDGCGALVVPGPTIVIGDPA